MRPRRRVPGRFDADRLRQNELVALGWRVLRFTWRRLTAVAGRGHRQDCATPGVVATPRELHDRGAQLRGVPLEGLHLAQDAAATVAGQMVDVEDAPEVLGLVLQAAREVPGAGDLDGRRSCRRRARWPPMARASSWYGPGTDRQPSSPSSSRRRRRSITDSRRARRADPARRPGSRRRTPRGRRRSAVRRARRPSATAIEANMSSISVASAASNDVTGRLTRCSTGSPTTVTFRGVPATKTRA